MKIKSTITIASLLLTSAMSLSSHAGYSLKGESVSGSRMPTTLATSATPFNKNYQQLNTEQKAKFRQNFTGLSAQQTPPFPEHGLKAIYRPIANMGLQMDVQGKLSASVLINKNGYVEQVTILQSPDAALSAKVTKLLQKTQFQAAVCEGVACEMNFPVNVSFI